MVGRVALRTVFFDTKLLDAVTSGPPAAIKQVGFWHLNQRKHQDAAEVAPANHSAAAVTPCRHACKDAVAYTCCNGLQVVLLGAGMDTRAWRLPLPEGEPTGCTDLPWMAQGWRLCRREVACTELLRTMQADCNISEQSLWPCAPASSISVSHHASWCVGFGQGRLRRPSAESPSTAAYL